MISGDFKKFTGSLIGLGILALIIFAVGFAAPAAGAPDPGGGGASGRANKIHGTVLNYPDGARQANMFVTIWRHDGGQFLTTRTNASGIYEFYNLDSNQKYNLVVNGIFQSGNNECPRTCPNFRREDPSRRCAVRNDVELLDGGDGWHGENFWLEPCQDTPPPSSCQAGVPADRWRGEYFNNRTLSGSPAMVRDDGNGLLNFDWGSGSPNPSCNLPSDNFSVRWTRTFYVAAGTYTFTATADDGVRVKLDGRTIIDEWRDQAPRTFTSGPIVLSAGNHTVVMEYYENGGGAVAKLAWQSSGPPSSCQASVPSDHWRGEYFNNVNIGGNPSMVRDDEAGYLSFDWGSASPGAGCGIGADNFSARWTRSVYFQRGDYTFTVTADDGVRFWIDDVLKLDKWFDQGPTTYTVGPVSLSSGNHAVKVEYYERGGGATLRLAWQQQSACQSTVPADRWKGEYFNNTDLSGYPVMVRDDGNAFLHFDWGLGTPSSSCGVPPDDFSVRWTRTAYFEGGTYRFGVTGDDGVRLWIDGQLKLDEWKDQGPTQYRVVPVHLPAGNHSLKLEYYERSGGATARLSWEKVYEWPNESSKANSDPWIAQHHNQIYVMKPKILALNFTNFKTMPQMRTHMQQVIQALNEGSRYHGYKSPNAPAFLQYELAFAIDLRDTAPPLPPYPYRNSTLYPRENPKEGYWGFDYAKLFTPEFTRLYGIPDPDTPGRPLSLCELIARGLVHEVWIYMDGDAPDVSAAEILELKPVYDENRRRVSGSMNRCAGNGCFDDEDNIPCTRAVRIAHMNASRGAGCFLESFSHGFESMAKTTTPYLTRYFKPFAGFDLNTKYGLGFDSWYGFCRIDVPPYDCLSYPSETSMIYSHPDMTPAGRINDYNAVCGNVHFTPNARNHYDLDSPHTVRTSCSHYRDGSGATEDFSIDLFRRYDSLAPDCMGSWLVWWRQNFPGLDNDSLDDQGNPMLNWWPFLFY